MRLGEAARDTGIKPDTIVNYIERFAEHFSEAARGQGVGQRDIDPFTDLLVLNTIRVKREQRASWEEIDAALRAGERDANFPPETKFLAGTTPIQTYQDTIILRQQLDQALQVQADLQAEIDKLRQADTAKQQRIEALLERASRAEGQVELLRDMLADKNKGAP